MIKKKFKVLSIDHIAIASKDFSGLEHLFSEVLGLKSTKKERVKTELVDVLKLYSEDNKTAIELLEPIENNTTVSKFLNSKIQGIHHLALTVDNISNAISYLGIGSPIIRTTPLSPGARGPKRSSGPKKISARS